MVINTKKEKPMLLSKFSVCHSKKLRFIKEQETSGSFSNLGLKTPLSDNKRLRCLIIKTWYLLNLRARTVF